MGRNHRGRTSQHARAVAGRRCPGVWWLGKEAAKTWRGLRFRPADPRPISWTSSRKYRHRHAFGRHGGAINVRNTLRDREVIQEIPSLEVIQPVKQEITVGREISDAACIDIGDDCPNPNRGVRVPQPQPCGFCLGHAPLGITLGEECLPLQVRLLDHVSIRDDQRPNARAAQQIGGDGP